ncbi:hypothetical protein XA68_14744 [Ophiocordyceps unilateralis]|uniref:Uncharacterized protein n=1 Tax=Ophiocordyceps unilateralis TaxID=268505 RepID=A0A2A9P822_OPHUN|nr:hypothetical protein XA68_14744 [Ophiocordyceps unilateralis]
MHRYKQFGCIASCADEVIANRISSQALDAETILPCCGAEGSGAPKLGPPSPSPGPDRLPDSADISFGYQQA